MTLQGFFGAAGALVEHGSRGCIAATIGVESRPQARQEGRGYPGPLEHVSGCSALCHL